MLIRAAAWLLLVIATCVPTAGVAFAAQPVEVATEAIVATTPPSSPPPSAPPPDTINDFLPVDRGIGDCISALPKPGCGSESRGGWRQTAVFGAIVLGISFIVWRIVLSSRRAKRTSETSS